MTIEFLRSHNCILLECISGSKSYGLDIATSDTDIKGVFVMPKENFYGLEHTHQVSNETNDVTFYELGRFVELLLKNNPNLLELLATPDEFVLYKHPLLDELNPNLFLSKLCFSSFANYAWSQIKKAKSLNKKIFNPVEPERKSVLDFCHVVNGNRSQPFIEWLEKSGKLQEQFGLAAMDHMKDLYAVYYDESGSFAYQGIIRKETSNEVSLSSIPKGEKILTYLHFNKDGYSTYCKKYKEYWNWVKKRNDVRYENTLQHGKNYDAKNMMHVFRLLDMAEEIALGRGMITQRPNREFLLSIRKGEFEYDYLLEQAEKKLRRIESLYLESKLPEKPDERKIKRILIGIREKYYEN